MALRLLSAALGIPLFLGLCVWGETPFGLAILAVAAIGLGEMVTTLRRQGKRPNLFLAALGLFYPAWAVGETGRAAAWIYGLDQALIFAGIPLLVLLAPVWEVVRAARTGEMRAAENCGLGLLCAVYISFFASVTSLREWHATDRFPSGHGIESGAALVLTVVFSVWATDTMAFFVGRALGKRKLAPTISPGKTVEGAIGGALGGMLAGAIFGKLLLGTLPFGLAIGAVAGIFGQVGDLFESALKREIGVKDFGGILPGHGGILDRFDSLLFAGPLVACLIYWFP